MSHRVVVVGTGYVGLVCGACFAALGHRVTCVDANEKKIAELEAGGIPIFEPGLKEIVDRERKAGRLDFATDTAAVVPEAEFVFIAVGTPPEPKTGNPDLTGVMAVTDAVTKAAEGFHDPGHEIDRAGGNSAADRGAYRGIAARRRCRGGVEPGIPA